MNITRYYKFEDDQTSVIVLGADNDDRYLDGAAFKEVHLGEWINCWQCANGFVVMVLDSEIISLQTRSSEVKRRTDLSKWCNEHDIDVSIHRNVVVLSGGGGKIEGPISRWYVKGSSLTASLSEIIHLAKRTAEGDLTFGDWPDKLCDRSTVLSQGIHALWNCLLPFQADCATLSEISTRDIDQLGDDDWSIVESIYNDYVGDGESGYICSQYRFRNSGDIIALFGEVCKGVLAGESDSALCSFNQAVLSGRIDLHKGLIGTDHRERHVSCLLLRDKLGDILRWGELIVDELRIQRSGEPKE